MTSIGLPQEVGRNESSALKASTWASSKPRSVNSVLGGTKLVAKTLYKPESRAMCV